MTHAFNISSVTMHCRTEWKTNYDPQSVPTDISLRFDKYSPHWRKLFQQKLQMRI